MSAKFLIEVFDVPSPSSRDIVKMLAPLKNFNVARLTPQKR